MKILQNLYMILLHFQKGKYPISNEVKKSGFLLWNVHKFSS